MIAPAEGARAAQAVLATAAFARAHGVALPADLLLDLERVQAMAAARGWQVAAKFDPDQPRVPAGNERGGQWTDDAAAGGAEARQALRPAKPARPTKIVYREKGKGDCRWAMDGLGIDEGELRQMFELDGYVAKLEVYTGDQLYSNPRAHKPAFIVRAEWFDTSGAPVGTAERLIMDEGQHQICYNEEMIFEPQFQDHDLAHKLYERQIEVMAKETEIDAIRLFADISIGRYAWAKKGFQYYRPEEVGVYNRQFRRYLTRLGVEAGSLPDLPDFTSPQEFANFKLPGVKVSHRDIANDEVKSGEYEVGKAFMLDQFGHGDWSGVLWLKK